MCEFYEGGRDKLRCFQILSSDFYFLWTTKERTDSNIVETIHVSRIHGF